MSIDDNSLPSSKEVLEGIVLDKDSSTYAPSESEIQYQEDFDREAIQSEISYAHLQGIIDHYSQKGKWSKFLMVLVGGMVAFQSVLLLLVGAAVLDFTKYEWLLPALLVQNLGQVIGLAVYAVKFLFSDIRGGKGPKTPE